MSRAKNPSFSSARAASTTEAPRAESARAVASPMPLDAPVTTATLPLNFLSVMASHLTRLCRRRVTQRHKVHVVSAVRSASGRVIPAGPDTQSARTPNREKLCATGSWLASIKPETGHLIYSPPREPRSGASVQAEKRMVERRRFTVEDYHKMAEAGIFGKGDRVEFINGEVVIWTRWAGTIPTR